MEKKEEQKALAPQSVGMHIKWTTKELPKRDPNKILSSQNYKCGTCGNLLKSNGISLLKSQLQYFYCTYTGLMYCTNCYSKQKAVIPYHVLHKLNCKPFFVCNAAKKFLDQMYKAPCIFVTDFAQTQKVQNDKRIIKLQKILFELKKIRGYLDICGQCSIYNEYKNDWIIHDGSLSLNDCVNILSTDTISKLQLLSNTFKKHIVDQCNTCTGNYCIICNDKNEIIYSFQHKVIQCEECNTCFHKKCKAENDKCIGCVKK